MQLNKRQHEHLAQTATETPCEARTRSWSGRLVEN